MTDDLDKRLHERVGGRNLPAQTLCEAGQFDQRRTTHVNTTALTRIPMTSFDLGWFDA